MGHYCMGFESEKLVAKRNRQGLSSRVKGHMFSDGQRREGDVRSA